MYKNAVITKCKLIRKTLFKHPHMDIDIFTSWKSFIKNKNIYNYIIIDHKIVMRKKILRDIVIKNLKSTIIILNDCDQKFNHPQIKTISKNDDIISKLSMYSYEKVIDSTLLKAGFSNKLLGYTYIKTALHIMINEDVKHVTKEIYPLIAEKHSTNIKCVERSIRHSIENTYSNLKVKQDTYYTFSKDRPSNYMYLKFLKNQIIEEKNNINLL